MRLRLLKQPTDWTCGQTCVAMATGRRVDDVCSFLGSDEGTKYYQLARLLRRLGFHVSAREHLVPTFGPLPRRALVRLKYPDTSNSHYVLFWDGNFYDPYYGLNPRYPRSWWLSTYLEIKAPV